MNLHKFRVKSGDFYQIHASYNLYDMNPVEKGQF
jgi:hypothetical protein